MPREPELDSFHRLSEIIDEVTIFVLAYEGEVTEPIYFEALGSKIDNLKVYLESIKPDDPSKSAPSHVLNRLKNFKKQYQLKAADELWMIVDRDRWGSNLETAINEALTIKSIHCAVSAPRFEFWLYLHHVDFDGLEEGDKLLIRTDAPVSNARRYLDVALSKCVNGFHKTRYNPELFVDLDRMAKAIERAEQIDFHQLLENPKQVYPQEVGSQVYLLVKKLLDLNVFSQK